MDRRRSAMPGPSSSIPKRAPSPSNAAFASSSRSGTGPLGSYRPASREGDEATPVGSRFGFPSSSKASTLAASRGTPSTSRLPPSSSTLSKRSISSAGLQDQNLTTPNGSANKRPFLTSTGSASDGAAARRSASSSIHDNTAMEAEHKRRELLAQQAYERLQQQYNAKGRELDKEREERLALIRQWESFSEEVDEERRSMKEQRKFLQERVNELQGKNNSLSAHIDEAETERAKAVHTAHSTHTDLSIRVADLEAQLSTASADAEAERQTRRRIETEQKRREAEWEEERKRLLASRGDHADSAKLTAELTGLLSKVRKLEVENLTLSHECKQLQARKDSVEALKEQQRDLEKKVGNVDELRRRLAEAEARAQDFDAEKEQWTASLHDARGTQGYEKIYAASADPDEPVPEAEEPASLTLKSVGPYLSILQGLVAGLKARCRTLTDRINSLRKQCDDAEETSQAETERATRLTHELEQVKTARLKSDKARETMTMEVESYKRLIDTYQQEAQNLSAQYDGASAQQISVLESQLQTRSDELETANRELEEARQALSRLSAPGTLSADENQRMEQAHETREKELLRSLDERREAYAELEKQCVLLGKANDDLFLRLGRGEFDQSKHRVLELNDNPISRDRVIRTRTLEALRKENAELLSQVKDLNARVGSASTVAQDSHPSDGDLVPAQTLENLRDEYDKLQKAMRDRDKAFDRLKEAFGAKATEYVAAVKALFGYDMHVLSRGKVKLRSVYARTSKGTSLTFDAGEEDDVANMRLVGEARQGAANVANLKRYWLGSDRCSVPCFLAALQLELYESTTQAARSGWAEGEE